MGDDWTALEVLPNKLSLVVVSEGPSSQPRAVDQVACQRDTCWALQLAGRSKLDRSTVSHQLGQRASQAKKAR